jgi:type II secretory pathway predicted ATPase ExeA/cell division septation protein DedD
MSGGPLTYEPFFGLRRKPFSLASDPEFLYESPAHAAALAALLAGIKRREGLIAFTGEVGTGKTTICRAVLRNLDRTTFSAFIPDPFASREDLLKMLLVDFGVTTVPDIATGPLAKAGRTELSYLLSSFLDTLVPLEAFVVVFIDEAQNMSLSLLEEVRILSDAFNHHGQLQVVLVGQLELLEKLKSPAMRQVDQRVSVYTHLSPLSPDDLVGYVHHRLQVAGATPHRPMFTPTAFSLIHEASGGIPRKINRLCDRALHLAHERRSPMVDRSLVEEVLEQVPAEAPPLAEQSAAPMRPVETNAFSTKVDAWLAHVDGGGTSTPVDASVSQFIAESALPAELTAPAPAPIPFEAPKREREPERYIQKLGRRWARAVVVGIVTLAALNAAVAAATFMPVQLSGKVEHSDLPQLPAPPALPLRPIASASPAALASTPEPADAAVKPGAARFAIAVGAYSTPQRAERTAQALRALGFATFIRQGRMLYQVMLGPFSARESAESALERLRTAGDHHDATLLPIQPSAN